MEFKTLVRPEHMNQHGSLFGGYMLLWVDEFAYIAAIEDFPGLRFVTRAMSSVEFTRGVRIGSVLTFTVTRQKIGKTSVTYDVDVTAREISSQKISRVFHTAITFCAVTTDGQKLPLPQIG